MKEWSLNTVLSMYNLIEKQKKLYDTRVPDSSNPQKDISKARRGDIAIIIPVDEGTFTPLDLPKLKYKILTVYHTEPRYDDKSWQSVVRRMFDLIPIEYIFPDSSLEEALSMYEKWPSTPRIVKEGIVTIVLGERLLL